MSAIKQLKYCLRYTISTNVIAIIQLKHMSYSYTAELRYTISTSHSHYTVYYLRYTISTSHSLSAATNVIAIIQSLAEILLTLYYINKCHSHYTAELCYTISTSHSHYTAEIYVSWNCLRLSTNVIAIIQLYTISISVLLTLYSIIYCLRYTISTNS